MKKSCLPFLVLTSLLLSSCSMPIIFWLFNNMTYNVTIITDNKEIKIDAGKFKESTGLDYAFSINSNNKKFTYDTKDISLLHVHWVGWGPFSKRMFYTQLQADGKIWMLSKKNQKAVKKFIGQPDGFPLKPNI